MKRRLTPGGNLQSPCFWAGQGVSVAEKECLRRLILDLGGEPVYGPRDVTELEKIRALGLPFWLAGSYGRPGKVAEALRLGATGVQVGTAFAFCEESGVLPELKREALRLSRLGRSVIGIPRL